MDFNVKKPFCLFALGVLYIGVAALFIGSVAYDLFSRGPLSWHIGRPSAVEGGIEALLLTVIVCGSLLTSNRWFRWVSVVVIALYLRRHNAELTMLVGVAYVEILLAVGQLILGRFGRQDGNGEVANLLAGIGTCLLVTFALSLFGWAFPHILLLVFVLLACVSLAIFRKRGLGVLRLVRPLRPESRWEKILLGLLVAWACVLAARTANVIGHDSLWYLARGDVVYAPLGSVFENLRFVSPVHYFPKLWETLVLPITAFDQLRLQEAVALAFMFVALVLVWQICSVLSVPRVWRYVAMTLLATLPAWASTALQMKSDVICTALLLMATLCMARWYVERSLPEPLLALAAAGLAASSKYTAIPYVGVIVVCLIVEAICNRKTLLPLADDDRKGAAFIVVVLCGLAAFVLLARTWFLAGAPTVGPDPLLSLWNLLGFELKDPVGTLNWTRPQNWAEVPRLFYEWLWAPSYMPKIRISWQGNYWFLFLLLGGLFAGIRFLWAGGAVRVKAMLLVLSFLGLLVAVAWRYHSRGGDGNYYMFPVALITCLSIGVIASSWFGRSTALTNMVMVSVVSFALFQGLLGFVSAAWSKPGTREFDLNLSATPFNGGEWREKSLRRQGLGKIEQFLLSVEPETRVVSFGFGQEAVLLSVPTEAYLSLMFARGDYTASPAEFIEYLQQYEIDYLLLAKDSNKVRAAAKSLDDLRGTVEDRGWVQHDGAKGTLYTVPKN